MCLKADGSSDRAASSASSSWQSSRHLRLCRLQSPSKRARSCRRKPHGNRCKLIILFECLHFTLSSPKSVRLVCWTQKCFQSSLGSSVCQNSSIRGLKWRTANLVGQNSKRMVLDSILQLKRSPLLTRTGGSFRTEDGFLRKFGTSQPDCLVNETGVWRTSPIIRQKKSQSPFPNSGYNFVLKESGGSPDPPDLRIGFDSKLLRFFETRASVVRLVSASDHPLVDSPVA